MLDLLLQVNIEIGCRHESNSQISWNNDIHNVDLLDHDTIFLKLNTKFIGQALSHLGFEISDSGNFDASNIVSNTLINFFL